ncbi:hypothetical protein N0V94_004304 [Neodidymelliopsis sp. IMI 364377]|nr:hypothetical protein N0V94_004304 [Neodidymelliopsis sp. IMI 364377]
MLPRKRPRAKTQDASKGLTLGKDRVKASVDESDTTEGQNQRQATPVTSSAREGIVTLTTPVTSAHQDANNEARPTKSKRQRVEDMVVPDSAWPENSSRKLKFRTREAVQNARSLSSDMWKPPTPDATIPTTDKERCEWVLRLVLAFENTDDIQGKKNFVDRWNNLGQNYTADAIEKLCWDLLDVAEVLHTSGITSLCIFDPLALGSIAKTRSWTFEVRIQHLIKLLCFWKGRCAQLMKASGLEECVAMPLEKMEAALENAPNNKLRQGLLVAGRQVTKGALSEQQEVVAAED